MGTTTKTTEKCLYESLPLHLCQRVGQTQVNLSCFTRLGGAGEELSAGSKLTEGLLPETSDRQLLRYPNPQVKETVVSLFISDNYIKYILKVCNYLLTQYFVMTCRKVITIFVPSLTSALNIKDARGDNIMTMIKTHNGLGCLWAYSSLPCHTLLFDRISEKQFWQPLQSEYSFRIL